VSFRHEVRILRADDVRLDRHGVVHQRASARSPTTRRGGGDAGRDHLGVPERQGVHVKVGHLHGGGRSPEGGLASAQRRARAPTSGRMVVAFDAEISSVAFLLDGVPHGLRTGAAGGWRVTRAGHVWTVADRDVAGPLPAGRPGAERPVHLGLLVGGARRTPRPAAEPATPAAWGCTFEVAHGPRRGGRGRRRDVHGEPDGARAGRVVRPRHVTAVGSTGPTIGAGPAIRARGPARGRQPDADAASASCTTPLAGLVWRRRPSAGETANETGTDFARSVTVCDLTGLGALRRRRDERGTANVGDRGERIAL
jgi:hypothetical protein